MCTAINQFLWPSYEVTNLLLVYMLINCTYCSEALHVLRVKFALMHYCVIIYQPMLRKNAGLAILPMFI